MKSKRIKEAAKFFAGLTAWESITHISFALNGNFPFCLMGIIITETINTIQIIILAMVSMILIYFAWIKKV